MSMSLLALSGCGSGNGSGPFEGKQIEKASAKAAGAKSLLEREEPLKKDQQGFTQGYFNFMSTRNSPDPEVSIPPEGPGNQWVITEQHGSMLQYEGDSDERNLVPPENFR